ncbi:SDR family NAD(P)-dependent oxidoreductase [Paenarthrobacter sp. CC6]|uniref:SDR family NAD(P)-dependent oxidoreductase n=1 Tax=Paenarthrobacter sp. CC6 TaxID=3029184 RepID=UPI00339C754D
MEELAGKSAVVTGAGGGMGRSIALALADAGVNVAVVDIDEAAALSVSNEVAERGVKTFGIRTDVSNFDDVKKLADTAYNHFGSVEILVNNAGVTLRPFRASWDTSYDDFRWMMDVNYYGVLHGHMAFVPRMRETPGEKHIVNTSSTASVISIAGHSAYSASKAAVDGLSNAVRDELKTQNIGLSILHPGAVRTRIATSERLRPEDEKSENRGVKPWADYVQNVANPIVAGQTGPAEDPDVATSATEYITPNDVGRLVVEGILGNKPHILTHPAPLEALQERFDTLLAGQPQPAK